MSKPTIYLDMDNVVFDTVETIKIMYDEDFRLFDDYYEVPLNQLTSYDFQELNLLTRRQLALYFSSGRFFDLVGCVDGAELSIASLNGFYKYPVTFVSIGTPENIRGKQIWVDEFNQNFQTDVKFIGVDAPDKSSIDMNGGILVDDVVQNLESSNAAVKICFSEYGWNKDWQGLRATNWGQLRYLIYEEAKKLADN